MALKSGVLVRETTNTSGAGTITLLGAVSGYRAFGAILADGDTVPYMIRDVDGLGWEYGLGTYTASGTTLARTTIYDSSNAGAAITLTAGTHRVYAATFGGLGESLLGQGDGSYAAASVVSEIVVYAGTALTLDNTYNGKHIVTTNGAAVSITTAAGLVANFECAVEQEGAGLVSWVQGASTTLRSRDSAVASAGQYAVMGIKHRGSDIFTLFGDIA